MDELGIPAWALIAVALLAVFFAFGVVDLLGERFGPHVTAVTSGETGEEDGEGRERAQEDSVAGKAAAAGTGAEQGPAMGDSGGIAH